MTATRLDWALEYAAFGWRVLSCWWVEDGRCACGKTDPGHKIGKHPLGAVAPNGIDNATTDTTIIRRWFKRYPRANLAVATGPESDLLVLDVDGLEGERSLMELERRHGPLPELYPMQWTGGGRGGWQAFFAYPQGRKVGNSGGKLGPKLDTRGARGYALIPPSVTIGFYEWAADHKPGNVPPNDAPSWLLELLDPPAQPEPTRETWIGHSNAEGDRYLLRALEAELALVASAPEGRRNDQLNESAFNLFRFSAEGRLAADAVAHGLKAAARHAGLNAREITSTLRSAATRRGVRL
jgi:hypothetical protein